MILLKTILNEWFQFTYLQYIFFKWFDSISFVFNFRKKYYLHLLYQKNLLQNFNLGTKIIFTCLKKKNEFLQFYLQKYFNLISFKKSDLYKLFKKT